MSDHEPRLSANPYDAKRQRKAAGHRIERTRRRHPMRTTVIAVVVALALFLGVPSIDRAVSGDGPTRNTTIDARDVSGVSGAELDRLIDEVAAEWARTPVKITSPAAPFDTTLADLGVTLERDDVRAAALTAGQDSGFLGDILSWWGRLLTPKPVPLAFDGDETVATAALTDLERQNHKDPVEATLTTDTTSGIQLVPAVPGTTIDRTEVFTQALDAARAGQRSISIEAPTVPIAPAFSSADADALLAEAEQLADRRLAIHVGDRSITVDAAVIRPWLSSGVKADGSGLEVLVDQAAVETDVPRLLGEVGTPAVQLTFAVNALGGVDIVEGTPGTRCCAPDSADRVIAAMRADQPRVDLDLTPIAPDHDRAWAEKLGIKEKVGEFTTPHACCAPRVTNIHLFADYVRGAVIEPGETLSLNERVGQRTEARGFVKDIQINNGKYEEAVGGGVSQFAATAFNAAFFAGLDIPTYQMHTIYIDRYPFGREATISWGGPDLELENITPYGVLVWPTYTDTSLTVTLYSTAWVVGEQTNQTVTEVKSSDPEVLEPCKKVLTQRTRTFLGDNRKETDNFSVTYQPGEGKTC